MGVRNLGRLPAKIFEFPTGYNTSFGVDRYRIPEILFNPTMVFQKTTGMEVDDPQAAQAKPAVKRTPIHKMVAEAISNCEPDHRFNLYNNIIVTGGNTMFPHFPDRLFSELATLAPSV